MRSSFRARPRFRRSTRRSHSQYTLRPSLAAPRPPVVARAGSRGGSRQERPRREEEVVGEADCGAHLEHHRGGGPGKGAGQAPPGGAPRPEGGGGPLGPGGGGGGEARGEARGGQPRRHPGEVPRPDGLVA